MIKRPVIGAILLSLLLVITFILGCGKPQTPTEEVPPEEFISENTVAENDFPIVVIDSTITIMASDLIKRLNNSFILPYGGILDSTTFIDTLENIIIDTLVSLEAENVDLKEDFNQHFMYLDRYRSFYVNYLFERFILDSIKVDSSKVDSFYQANEDMFRVKEQVHARHIMVSPDGLMASPDSARFAEYSENQLDSISKALIHDYYAMYEAGATIEELASQYSVHDESARRGGDLGYFSRGTYIKDFEDVVFSLDTGEVTKPFQSQDGWHIVELIDRVDSGKVPLEGEYYEMARQQVQNELARQIALSFVDSLAKLATYEFNDSALAQPVSLVPRETWSVVINRIDTLYFVKLGPLFSNYARHIRKDSLTVEDKKNALRNISRQLLIMQAGDDLGYDEDSVVATERRKLKHKYSKAIVYSRGRDTDFRVTDSMVEAYYNQHIDNYIIEKPLKVQHIIVKDSVFGEFLRDQAMSGVDFLELAQEHYPGAEEIRVAAADLGYIGPDEMPPEFYDAASRTPIGKVSHPVKTELGYHIIKVVDRKLNMDIEQVRGEIKSEIKSRHHREYRRRWIGDLKSKHDLQYYLDDIKRIKIFEKEERKLF